MLCNMFPAKGTSFYPQAQVKTERWHSMSEPHDRKMTIQYDENKDCAHFQATYPALLKVRHNLEEAAEDALVNHREECAACKTWSALSCDTYNDTMRRHKQGMQVSEEMEDLLAEHMQTCDICDVISCSTCQNHMLKLNQEAKPPSFLITDAIRYHHMRCTTCSDAVLEAAVAEFGLHLADYPCVHVAYHSHHTCDQHADAWSCPDTMLVRTKDGEFGMPVRDGGPSFITINNCPWCGVSLKPSQSPK